MRVKSMKTKFMGREFSSSLMERNTMVDLSTGRRREGGFCTVQMDRNMKANGRTGNK